jgi:peptidoglycan/xylan/chitin deacetylase (PgdA/CDA1 family)
MTQRNQQKAKRVQAAAQVGKLRRPALAVALVAALAACETGEGDDDDLGGGTGGAADGGSSNAGTGGTSSGGASAGTAGTAGGGGKASGGDVPNGGSVLPLPPGGGVAKPSGAPGGLRVLDWAGFEAALSYTFDDSLSSQIRHYPELQATGVRMTFYLVSSLNATSPTWAEALADGHELGNHTAHHCHQDGTSCGAGSFAGSPEAELDQCTEHLIEQFGVEGVYTSASPYGDAGYGIAAEGRLLLNRGVNSGQIAPNDRTNPFQLPCYAASEGTTADSFNVAIDSARSNGRWQIMLIHSLGGDGGYAPIDIEDLVASIEHAKSAEDVWVDSVVNVGAYWSAQKLFSELTPTSEGDELRYTWSLPAQFPPGKFLRVSVDGGTPSQGGSELAWNDRGYYELELDAGELTLGP